MAALQSQSFLVPWHEASLKQCFDAAVALRRAAFPRALARGLIEAAPRRPASRCGRWFPRASARGLIEAARPATPRRCATWVSWCFVRRFHWSDGGGIQYLAFRAVFPCFGARPH